MTEERQVQLLYLWENERTAEDEEWRDELTAEEVTLVAAWDEGYEQSLASMVCDHHNLRQNKSRNQPCR